MLHAILITGNSWEQRKLLAQKLAGREIKPEPDNLVINSETSIGISDIKPLAFFLSRKPLFQEKKIVFIAQAEKLTVAAQNALLKILEEPPPNSLIVLIALETNQLLPTIISRCAVYALPPELTVEDPEISVICQKISRSSPAGKISLAAIYGQSKDMAILFCQNQNLYLRNILINQKQYQLTGLIRKINKTITDLKQNVNPKLCLENLFFHYTNDTFINYG